MGAGRVAVTSTLGGNAGEDMRGEQNTTADRLAEVEAQLVGLTNGLEPRATARRILELIHERDRLRVELGTRIHCAHCREAFAPPRADARYCSHACRQAAHRRRRVTDKPQRVTALAAREPRCGVSRPNGRRDGLKPTDAPHRNDVADGEALCGCSETAA